MANKISKSEVQWKQQLSDEQYKVTRKKATEPAFTGKYHDCKTPGIYECVCCGMPLFDAKSKYDSGSGWPSYYEAASPSCVRTETDSSLSFHARTEVLCARCDAHLGHVFDDGPQPTGKRYCINSAALSLKEEE